MMTEELNDTRLYPVQEDSQYPYHTFLRDRGWKYTQSSEKAAAYQREISVRHGKILSEEDFAAEAGLRYEEPAKRMYPKLKMMAEKNIIGPWELCHYARYHWCMKNPEALIYVQTAYNKWAVNSCDDEISAEQALEIVCRNWGFDKARVTIQEPAYYESTDWNFIRFSAGKLGWVMKNGDLNMVYD